MSKKTRCTDANCTEYCYVKRDTDKIQNEIKTYEAQIQEYECALRKIQTNIRKAENNIRDLKKKHDDFIYGWNKKKCAKCIAAHNVSIKKVILKYHPEYQQVFDYNNDQKLVDDKKIIILTIQKKDCDAQIAAVDEKYREGNMTLNEYNALVLPHNILRKKCENEIAQIEQVQSGNCLHMDCNGVLIPPKYEECTPCLTFNNKACKPKKQCKTCDQWRAYEKAGFSYPRCPVCSKTYNKCVKCNRVIILGDCYTCTTRCDYEYGRYYSNKEPQV